MHTQCPHCQTIFRISAAQLNIAQGYVRCNHCHNIFNASHHLLKSLPNKKLAQKSLASAKAAMILEADNDDIPDLLKEDIYVPKTSWSGLIFWLIVSVFLIALLVGQYAWFMQRDQVLQHSQVRPLLERACNVLLCTLPETRDLKSFHMDNSVVLVKSDNEKILQVEAIFSNQAFFPQPYPDILLTFEDANGVVVAQRRFRPVEYLNVPYIDKQLNAKATVHLRLEIKDEEQKLKNESYHFKFL